MPPEIDRRVDDMSWATAAEAVGARRQMPQDLKAAFAWRKLRISFHHGLLDYASCASSFLLL